MLKLNLKIAPVIAFLTLVSCVTDTEINTPALQAAKNDALFKTEIHKAILNTDGSLTISGSVLTETINMTIQAAEVGMYSFENSTTNSATFVDREQNLFSTDSKGNGFVELTQVSDNTISGNFRFDAIKQNNSEEVMHFQKGWMYRIPIENASETVDTPCELSSITAMIDTNSLTTNSNIAQNLGDFILITGASPQEEITLFFPSTIEVGDYPLSSSGTYSATYEINNDRASAVSGTLSITSHDIASRCIIGDFNYVTTTSVNISDGHFEIGY